MRDIKPTGNKRKTPRSSAPEDLPPEAKRLYEEHAKKATTRRFTGSKIPVTSVHVPKQSLPEKREESRPLFAKVDITKSVHRIKRSGSMRLGKKERTILVSLLGVLVVTSGIALFIFLPSASINLTIKTSPLLIDQKFTIAADTASIPSAIPGNVFEQKITIQGSSPVASTEVVGTKAKGKVQLINKTFDEQKIKERSRLVTKDNVLFYMTKSATIPAASSSGVSSITIEVEAAEAGEQGNIAPQKLNFAALDSSAQTVVYGQNDATLTGGSGKQVNVIRESDLEQAKAAAQAQAKTQVSAAANTQLQKGWSLLEESWETTFETFTPTGKLNDRVDAIPYSASGTVRVMAFKDATLMATLEQALKAALDTDYMLFPGPISYTKSIEKIDWDTKQISIITRVTHTTIPMFSINTLKDKLSGRSKAEAINYLQGLPGVQNATVDTWPFWVQSIPEIQKRIDIKISSDREP
ncbi:MAG TPA: baseplate J/gp47 family protein [Candidatus Andersenbacteria bacterium]|nr:baseplate J/gp47 family protein [Candidatus Andersenbacteria bacterium]